MAHLKAMCSDYQSGGVNTDHSESAVGVAATMAHEMGHNFGMSHDAAGCCRAKADDGGCIMAAATGHPFPRLFTGCNLKELNSYLSSGGGKCLSNPPNTRNMYGGQRCGNGYLEEGEECDCGEEELKSPGALCRAPSGSCDLPEFCDGKEESCPANFHLADGAACGGGRAYCYTGMCLSLEQQCLSLDAQCGKIQCLSSASKPVQSSAVRIVTSVTVGSHKVQCMGTHVYKPGQADEDGQADGDGQGDTLDPGLVMTGTKCGVDSICFDGECRHVSFLRADECNAKCHGHGVSVCVCVCVCVCVGNSPKCFGEAFGCRPAHIHLAVVQEAFTSLTSKCFSLMSQLNFGLFPT
ncbi:Disintegrin and metalloproteinase domain-containing protein 19 [Liparis tanakae]|uniref:Disintegrin and metalloproteinase domain-containing protein 19 n=1 Tax=Liparis tanakae TaxID=230148 RepID=A0A4Z2EPL8_9TELE|nr:Disintegrin and metalloproteinase domain-containing protein 19 [Liparis tanakae]